MKKILTIAGTDPTGGAGISADLEAISYFKCKGCYSITAVNAQNDKSVSRINPLNLDLVKSQIDACKENISAVKTGMLACPEIVELVASYNFPNLVCDPVLRSSSGYDLFTADIKDSIIKKLLPKSRLFTPNISECEEFFGTLIHDVSGIESAARKFIKAGANAVLIKGGHLDGENSADFLFSENEDICFWLESVRSSKSLRGTGCRLSAAIAANLALGHDLKTSCRNAKDYIDILFI